MSALQDIELLLNEDPRCDETNEDLVKYRMWRATVPDWTVYRTEWSIYHEEACIAGQIDSLWKDKDGQFHMVDWKRCKVIEPESREKGYPPFDRLPNSNLGHYTVQQNAYAYILKEKYGIECASLSLVQIHPDAPTFLLWKLELMPEQTAKVFKQREDLVKEGVLVGMVQASAGKPRPTAKQQAALDAEQESDMRIATALRKRADELHEKWEQKRAKT